MKSDGSVYIDTNVSEDGLKKGFERIKNDMDSVAKDAQKAGNLIEASFSKIDVSDSVRKTAKEIETAAKEIGNTVVKTVEDTNSKVALTGYHYDTAEIEKFVNDYANGVESAEKHTSDLRMALEEAEKAVADLEERGFFWDDEEYIKAQKNLIRIQNDIKEAQYYATHEPEKKNPFGLDTYAGKIREVEIELQRLAAAGKGLGDPAYDEVYRKLSLLKAEAKAYAAELAKTPEQAQKEAEAQEAKEARIIASAQRAAAAKEKAAKRAAAAEEKASQRAIAAAKKEQIAKQKAAKSAAQAATKPLQRFGTRLGSIISGALFFNLIGSALRKLTSYYGSALKENDAFAESFAKLKGALLTAFQPIYEYVIPGLIKLMDILTVAVQKIGVFFASLSGKSYSEVSKNAEALYNEANAIDKVGSSAKKAQKQLAGFDEINRLGSGDTAAGSSSSTTIAPKFDTESVVDPEMVSGLENILRLVGSIAAGLSTWKIASKFTESLKESGGLALTAAGAFLYATNWADAFANGIDWENLSGMLGGLAGVVGGLFLAFGKTGGAIGLLVSGIGLIVVSLKEWIKTGKLTTQGLVSLTSGIIAVGAAISLLTGNWIPVLIAAFASVVVTVATKGDEIKSKLQELNDWLKGPFTKDWRDTFGPVFGGIFNGFFSLCEKLWKNVKSTFEGFIDFINGIFSKDWNLSLSGLVDLALGVFSGMNGILGSPFFDLLKKIKELGFAGAMEDIKRQIVEKWEELKSILSSPFDAIITKISGISGNLKTAWKNGINSVITIMNKFISWLNNALSFTIKPITVLGKTIFAGSTVRLANIPNIPYLAQGAVIPPNAPFMAMLGDQRHGTNIEAPLSTIQEAVANVMNENVTAMMAGFEALLEENRLLRQVVEEIEVGDTTIGEAVNRYNRKMAVVRGG